MKKPLEFWLDIPRAKKMLKKLKGYFGNVSESKGKLEPLFKPKCFY